MPTNAADVIRNLPALEWRGLTAPPYDVLTVEFAHDQPARPYPYRDGEGHDGTGRKSFVMPVRLFFLNTIGEGILFPDAWEGGGWKDALLDPSPDDLQHPILGPTRAVVLGGKFEIKASIRSGMIVDVNFAEHLDDPAGPTGLIAPTIDPVRLAKLADVACTGIGVPYPGTDEVSLFAAFKAIAGAIFSAAAKITGKLRQIIGNVEAMIDTVDSLNSAVAWSAKDALLQLWTSLSDIAKKAAAVSARPVLSRVVGGPTTLAAFADSVGNSLRDVMSLNLAALRSPVVGRGTVLRYYSGK